jgi:hypothetical protein
MEFSRLSYLACFLLTAPFGRSLIIDLIYLDDGRSAVKITLFAAACNCAKTPAGRAACFAGMKTRARRKTLSRKWPAMYRHCPHGSQSNFSAGVSEK